MSGPKFTGHFAKFGGVIAVGLQWLSLILFYLIQPDGFNGAYPISHFASVPKTRLIFSICYALAGISFWLFIKYYLRKYYQVPLRLFTISMAAFVAVAIIPFDPNDKLSFVVHVLLAQVFALTFLFGILITAQKSNDLLLRRVSIGLAIAGISSLFAFLILAPGSSLSLVFEILTGIVCQIWILWMTFYSRKELLKERKTYG